MKYHEHCTRSKSTASARKPGRQTVLPQKGEGDILSAINQLTDWKVCLFVLSGFKGASTA